MISFGDLLWSLFWVFAFAAYLLAMIAVIADLFQDRELSGWWKAVWVVLLVFVPFLTALVYLVMRGPQMQDRLTAAAQGIGLAADAEADAGRRSSVDEIGKAKELLDSGAITAEEFALLKGRVLADVSR